MPAIAVAALIGAGIGGAANVWDKWGQLNSIGDGFAAFGIGAVGGAATGAIGFASGGAGLLGGAAYGAASGVSGDLVTQIGNGLYFEDAYNGNRTLLAGALGGVIGGAIGAFSVPKGVNPWTGKPLEESISSVADLYARYGEKASDLLFASGQLPKGSKYAVTKLGSRL